jgi:farnesyl-diphosphate farnesyltransferase
MNRLDDLLEKTSRTFALSIPVLPEPTRREVTIAYLLFRIADTFEDAAHWSPEDRIAALAEFEALLGRYDRARAEALASDWVGREVAHHAGYRELMAETPFVLEQFLALSPGAVLPIREHVIRSARGMEAIVARTRSGELTLHSIRELQDYCYLVAGIVGEMLTELFVLDREPLAPIAAFLRERAATFGEALQLVNILKDSAGDAEEGRRYLPEEVPVADVFALARKDLGIAGEYIRELQRAGAPRGIIEFTALPVRLAWAALERVEDRGPGAKVSRPEVFLIVQKLKRALDRNEPVA